jgi:hypothetical protein
MSRLNTDERNFLSEDGMPLFWTWVEDTPHENYDRLFKLYATHGVRGINFKGSLPAIEKIIPIAQKYNIDLYVWWWVMNQPELAKQHPEWLDVNADGDSLVDKRAYVDHYKFLNPAIEDFRNELYRQTRYLCQLDGIKGISLDFARYVDVILPENLQPKYGIVQDKVYAQWDYGYHPVAIEKFKRMHGYDPKTLSDPSQDETWRSFRMLQVTECVKEIADIVRNHHLKVSASPFPTPSVARQLVMQDWENWQLDFYLPMAYYKFYNQTIDWVYATTRENVAAVQPASVITAIYVEDVLQDELDVRQMVQTVLENGSSGLAFFGIPDTNFLHALSTFKRGSS